MPLRDLTPPQTHTAEATVVVWRNVTKLGFIPTGHFGHAAIMLRSPATGGPSNYRYISWWPPSAGKSDAFRSQEGISESRIERDMIDEMGGNAQEALQQGRYQPRANQVVVETNAADDPTSFGVTPDVVLAVPGIHGRQADVAPPNYGLHVGRMWEWFEDYQQDNGIYQLASKTQSCSGVALVALVEGGAKAFAKPPSNLIYSKPNQVESYAQTLRRNIRTFNQELLMFRVDAERTVRQRLPQSVVGVRLGADLPTVEQFKTQSALRGKVRSSRLRKIDSALASYHNHPWTSFKEKYGALVSLLKNIVLHRREKPDSARAVAICTLGMRALQVDVLAMAPQSL